MTMVALALTVLHLFRSQHSSFSQAGVLPFPTPVYCSKKRKTPLTLLVEHAAIYGVIVNSTGDRQGFNCSDPCPSLLRLRELLIEKTQSRSFFLFRY